jgi:hypothetical protein
MTGGPAASSELATAVPSATPIGSGGRLFTGSADPDCEPEAFSGDDPAIGPEPESDRGVIASDSVCASARASSDLADRLACVAVGIVSNSITEGFVGDFGAALASADCSAWAGTDPVFGCSSWARLDAD